jgi:Chromo (CHRromatin Organisation MOdifier) domain
VQRKVSNKLSSKYYGPFEVVKKIGKVAYKLNLPAGSQIHPVFHISQLKEKVGSKTIITPDLPLVGQHGQLKVESIAVLDRRLVQKGNEPCTQILIRWSNLPDSDATWEDYLQIRQQFPFFKVEDNLDFERRGMSAMVTDSRRGKDGC